MHSSTKNDTTFILVEKSFIIQQGLLRLLHDFGNLLCLEIIEEPAGMNAKILELEPDFVIINTRFLSEYNHHIKSFFPENFSTKFIALLETIPRLAPGHSFDACIQIDDSEAILTEKLKKLIDNDLANDEDDKNEDLSEREKDVIKCIANGLTNKEIADKLYISIHTVITHRKNITRKLGIKSVSGLTVYALLNKLVSMDEIDS